MRSLLTIQINSMRYLYPLLLSLLALLFLQSCTTTDDRRDPSAPYKYFIPDDEVIYKAETTSDGRDADFIITADAIYVMYGRNYAYLNPAYVCHYAIFPYEPVLEGDLIKIDCRGGGEGVRYIQFKDKTKATLVFKKITAVRSGSLPDLTHDASYKTDSEPIKRPRYFQVTENVVYKTKTSFDGKDAEFVVTELAVYVLYGGGDVYLNFNPAYECLYKDFLRTPVEKSGLIGITCKRGAFGYALHYFQIPDSKNRAIAFQQISDQLSNRNIIVWNDAWRNKHLMIAEESFKVTGVTSPETCIPDQMIDKSQNSEDFVYAPGVVLHPDVLPYVVADPALLVFVFFGGILVDIDNLIQDRKTNREEKRQSKRAVDPRKQTPQIGSSTELSVVLAVTADSVLKNKVAYIAKPCDQTEDEIGSYTSAYTGLSDSFSTIVEIDDYSGELLKHENPIHEGLDTELQISSNYRVVDTTSGSVIKTGKVQYVNSQPLNALNKNEINVVMIEEVIQDAYRDISELIVDSLLSIE